MEEDSFIGKYVYINYIDTETNVATVCAGKLEKFVCDSDGSYKAIVNPIFDINSKGKYIKMENNSIKAILPNNYIGMTEDTEKNIKKFYNDVNKQIEEREKNIPEQLNPEYIKLGNTKHNFYSHKTRIGFRIDKD